MKRPYALLSAAGVLAISACAAGHDRLDPRGSYPDAGAGNVAVESTGKLEVRIGPAIKSNPGGKAGLRYLTPGYVVHDREGRRIVEVRNRIIGGSEEVAQVDLPAGKYLIRLDAWTQSEPSVFWVTVQEGKLTRIDVPALRQRPAGGQGY